MFLCPRVFTQLAEDKRFQELVLILDPLLEENPWQLGSLLVTVQWDTNVTHVKNKAICWSYDPFFFAPTIFSPSKEVFVYIDGIIYKKEKHTHLYAQSLLCMICTLLQSGPCNFFGVCYTSNPQHKMGNWASMRRSSAMRSTGRWRRNDPAVRRSGGIIKVVVILYLLLNLSLLWMSTHFNAQIKQQIWASIKFAGCLSQNKGCPYCAGFNGGGRRWCFWPLGTRSTWSIPGVWITWHFARWWHQSWSHPSGCHSWAKSRRRSCKSSCGALGRWAEVLQGLHTGSAYNAIYIYNFHNIYRFSSDFSNIYCGWGKYFFFWSSNLLKKKRPGDDRAADLEKAQKRLAELGSYWHTHTQRHPQSSSIENRFYNLSKTVDGWSTC